ncbi:MAG: DUF4360 domain-containing protein [Bdellovibrionota bacterium]
MKEFLIFASLVIAASVQAQTPVSFRGVSYAGSGCPQGTVSTATSPDGTSLSILFDEFRAEVPQYDGNNDNDSVSTRGRPNNRNTATLAHRKCALSFTADLPPGTKADSLEISFEARGATILDPGVEGSFASILVGYQGIANSRGNPTVIINKHWRARPNPQDDNWTGVAKPLVNLNSGCSGANGKSIRFDLKNHISAEITDGNLSRHGLLSVDSNDVTGLLKFTVRTRPCGGGR